MCTQFFYQNIFSRFLRSQKEYSPPENIESTIDQIYKETVGANAGTLTNDKKYKFLSACANKIGHGVPNSLLHTIIQLDDAKKFYQTPVNTTLPLDTMQKLELPKNLHIEHEYTRFHPETDTMFNGISAFPQSSNLVTGLKTRKKYTGFTTKKPWPS